MANEAASYGIQVYGGHGYVKEWGMEQIARDARIASIYEGTTGIQALDLLGRKVLATEGKIMEPFIEEVRSFIEQAKGNDELQPMLDTLAAKVDEWTALAGEIAAAANSNPDEINASAYDFLMYSGYVTVAYFLARSMFAALASDGSDFYQDKIDSARFYSRQTVATDLVPGCNDTCRRRIDRESQLAEPCKRLVQRVDHDISVFPRKHERRTDLDNVVVSPDGRHEDARLAHAFHDLDGFRSGRLAGRSIRNELDAHKQSFATYFADDRVPFGQRPDPGKQVVAGFLHVSEQIVASNNLEDRLADRRDTGLPPNVLK